ncbi:MAG: hypothetical protein OXK74_01520 [Gemmatimonadota bacterium]|nr:hypothetical protein [Gemmatimonadota bacterium]
MLCAAVVVAAASGCETIAPEVQDTAIVTAGNSFQLVRGDDRGHTWYRATIPYSFTNRTGSKVYIDLGCGDRHHYVQMYEGGEWVWFVSRIDCLIGSGFTAIEPGEVHQDTLRTGGCTSGGSCAPRLTLPDASTLFRIVWDAWSSVDEDPYGNPIPGDPVPLEERVSNHFTFEVVEASH